MPRALRVADAAWYTGLSRSTLYKLRANGRLSMLRVAGRTLILRAELDRLLAEAAASGQR